MTQQEFSNYWKSHYPYTLPLPHLFKYDYKNRWFRIHNLPENKRQSESREENGLLLTRQNFILKDILGEEESLFGISGEYDFNGARERPEFMKNPLLENFVFNEMSAIDMNAVSPEEFEPLTHYRVFITQIKWKPNLLDDLLVAIANDEIRMFFLSVDRHCLIAPYDGGIDFVMENLQTRNLYKARYKDWLSNRPDGL